MSNLERDQQIAQERASGLTLTEIGKKHGMSRERARQIAKKQGVVGEYYKKLATARTRQQKYDEAEMQLEEILDRYIAGELDNKIANDMCLSTQSVREVINTNITDVIISMRYDNLYADYDSNPVEENLKPRYDRYWTKERIIEVLTNYALANDGIPSSPQYQKISSGNENLPSFKTIRNRVGRWTHVRIIVNQAIRERGIV